MLADDGRPMIASSKKALGVVVGPGKFDDICADDVGQVHPGSGGMSVAPHWTMLPFFRIPARLSHVCAKARGDNRYCCWRMGAGKFENGALADQLHVNVDSVSHGTVEPAQSCTVELYQAALAATAPLWVLDEGV